MQNSSRLALYHYWVAFAAFLPAVLLGAWQMLMRSPLPAPLDDPNAYYASVTLHGTAMAYVITTFFAMGFGYAVTATSLGRPVRVEGAIGVVELDRIDDVHTLRRRFLAEGVFVRPFGSIVYLAPAFTIAAEELDALIRAVVRVVGEMA